MKAELKCAMCFVQCEAEKGLDLKEPKVANAHIVYQGISLCKKHMIAMMEAQVKQATSKIAVPTIKLS